MTDNVLTWVAHVPADAVCPPLTSRLASAGPCQSHLLITALVGHFVHLLGWTQGDGAKIFIESEQNTGLQSATV